MHDEIIGEAHFCGKYYLVIKTGQGTIYLKPDPSHK